MVATYPGRSIHVISMRSGIGNNCINVLSLHPFVSRSLKMSKDKSNTMQGLWSKFRQGLALHVEDVETVLLTNSGANEKVLQELEAFTGTDLPDDYREFMLLHDGQKLTGGFSYGVRFYSIQTVLDWSKDWDAEHKSFNERGQKPEIFPRIKGDLNWRIRWIVIAGDSVDHWVMDLDPCEEENQGQIFELDENFFIGRIVADSFSQLIESATDQLVTKRLSASLPVRYEFD